MVDINIRLKYWLLSAMLLFFLILVSGCGNELTRGEATNIISKAKGYPVPISARIYTGRFMPDKLLAVKMEEFNKVYSELESLGYIKYKRLGKWQVKFFYDTIEAEVVEVSLTDKGKKTFTLESTGKGYEVWKAVMCNAELSNVTGISMNADGVTAKVEYSWEIKPTSDIFNAVTPIIDTASDWPSGTYPGWGFNLSERINTQIAESLTMRKYDDGWRIASGLNPGSNQSRYQPPYDTGIDDPSSWSASGSSTSGVPVLTEEQLRSGGLTTTTVKPKNPLVGKWVMDDDPSLGFEFFENGKVVAAGERVGEYSIKGKGSLVFRYNDGGDDAETNATYSVSGDSLTINWEDGVTAKYHRVK